MPGTGKPINDHSIGGVTMQGHISTLDSVNEALEELWGQIQADIADGLRFDGPSRGALTGRLDDIESMAEDLRNEVKAHPGPERGGVIRRDPVAGPHPNTIAPYLWHNFRQVPEAGKITIIGVDTGGFTLDALRDRLSSGLIAMEIVQ